MKETGIVRRVDDLGRFVIPKEVRRTLGIREGDELELFVDNGKVILQKYSVLAEVGNYAACACRALHMSLDRNVIVCDMDKIIASTQYMLKDKPISAQLRDVLNGKMPVVQGTPIRLCEGLDGKVPVSTAQNSVASQFIMQIIVSGEIVGGIVVISTDSDKALAASDMRTVETVARMIGMQLAE